MSYVTPIQKMQYSHLKDRDLEAHGKMYISSPEAIPTVSTLRPNRV